MIFKKRCLPVTKRIFFLFFLALWNCKNKPGPDLVAPRLENPSVMLTYCSPAGDQWFRRTEYRYDNGLLVNEKTDFFGGYQTSRSLEYDENKNLVKETLRELTLEREKNYIYNEQNQVILIRTETRNLDSEGNVINRSVAEMPREYENNLLVREGPEDDSHTTYQYENNKVILKTTHAAGGHKHHITRYRYTGNLLAEEIKETAAGSKMYTRHFQYDARGRLIRVTEDGKTIQENRYKGNRLEERRIFYFGIDPGFSPCGGNYTYRYEY